MVSVDTIDRDDATDVQAFFVTRAGNVASGCRATNRGHCCRAVRHTVHVCLVGGCQRVASCLKEAANVAQKTHTFWGRGSWKGGGWMDWRGEVVEGRGGVGTSGEARKRRTEGKRARAMPESGSSGRVISLGP